MLTRQENIFLAKKNLVEVVYNAAYIEGCNVTFPQTQTIIDGAVVNGISVDDIQTVLNLRDAWKYCINTIDEPLSLDYVCKINEFVSRNESLAWGQLRTGQVGVGDFTPTIPQKADVIARLRSINTIENVYEKAFEYFAYACKQQLFWDGNKRTSTIVSNKILIENGAGILTIDKTHAELFNTTLRNWYLQDDIESFKDCLRQCVKTLSMGSTK